MFNVGNIRNFLRKLSMIRVADTGTSKGDNINFFNQMRFKKDWGRHHQLKKTDDDDDDDDDKYRIRWLWIRVKREIFHGWGYI